MRTQKIWILLSMILFIGFTACSDDDDKGSALIGTWRLTHTEGYEKENGQIADEWDEDVNSSEDWVVSSKTITFWMDGDQYEANYTYKDDKLYLGDDDDIVFNVLKLTDGELILELKMKEGNYELYDKSTFKKIK